MEAGGANAPSLRLGLVPPVVQRNPRFDPPAWEQTAGIAELTRIATAADRLGYDFLCFPEHVAIPTDVEPRRGATYWSPLPTMGYLAAETDRICLATYCAVLPYHHPLELVKQLGTLDELSGGRVICGVGVGSLEPEFDLLEARFDDRGERADDAVRAIRTCFGQRTPTYSGTHFEIADMVVEPCGLDRDLEVWIGGRSAASLRRARTLAHGWAPFGLLPDQLAELLGDGDDRLRGADGKRLELVLPPEPPIDPAGDRDGTLRQLHSYVELGATALALRFRQDSVTHYLEQLEALAELRPYVDAVRVPN